MNPPKIAQTDTWKHKISNAQQLGGIETSVLDNGAGRGVRIAWINTGTGLRYKVVFDRGLDILDCFYNESSLSWISHAGLVAPQPFSNQGIDWLRTFGGGLLTTCGLSNAGPPNSDENGSRGLHGNYSNLSCELLSIKNPDVFTGDLSFEIIGKVRETSTFGPSLELTRKISGTLGSASIKISDTVVNRGNSDAPHMLLYHINCGWPLIDDGTRIVWKGSRIPRESDSNLTEFNKKHDFKLCAPPLKEHAGFGEDVAFIDPATDASDLVTCGFANDQIQLALKISFSKKQMPWLIHWQHWGENEYVTALEPATNPPIGQTNARKDGTLILLKPGESRSYDLELEVITGERVNEFKM
ncbi:aldose 1-epimerase family protein [Algoriphagus pacificus]|uniref:Aldose 1-epimerase family protein n=1 Tax=Algoriphagus pacificus TaxID=2811234 RepID=A0ABS3CKH9_9BACT|nr:aldose 1-epimerase family protein [Algoriphagus pacificus]MBN7817034.1 aldose 1-epimerase family protein [Algoriphagus pacificus]